MAAIALVSDRTTDTDKIQNRIGQLGLELEMFRQDGGVSNFHGPVKGFWTKDAGKDLYEMVTGTVSSSEEAVSALQDLVSQVTGDTYFSARRPDVLAANQGAWNYDPRYDAVVMALKVLCPHAGDKVNEMTNSAATHVNISGDFDPVGEDGTFLINMMNLLGPYLAHQIHREINAGYQHMAIWSDFAPPEYLPQYGRWFRDARDMVRYFQSANKLVKQQSRKEYLILPKEPRDIYCPLDLGTNWWLMRFKRSGNQWYLELRILPSMHIDQVGVYVQLCVDVINAMLTWFHGQNEGRAVESMDDSVDACEFLNRLFPNYLPNSPLSEDEWRLCFMEEGFSSN